jgi:hypothetical protein
VATDYDSYLAPLLEDETAEAAQVVFPRHPGSVMWGVRRLARGGLERKLRRSNLLAVTESRVLIFPQHFARGTGLTLEPAILDWPRPDVQASAERKCHTFSGDSDRIEGEGADYVLMSLRNAADTVEFELNRKGHQAVVRALGIKLGGKWT